MLGRGRLTVELCRRRVLGAVPVPVAVPTVDTLVRLGERTAEDDDGWCSVRKLPDCRESDCRGTLALVADDAVCVVRLDGS